MAASKPKLAKKGRRAAPNKKALRPRAAPPRPSASHAPLLPRGTANVRVTEETALTLSPVWRAINFIAGGLASLPCRAHRRRPGGGSDVADDSPVDWCLHTQANDETPAVAFVETQMGHAPGWGNAYAEIERDLAGRLRGLWQITPDRVEPARVRRDGRLVYDVDNFTGPNQVLEAEDVLHVKGLGFDGLKGYSVVRMAAQSMGTAISGERYAGEFWGNDATPGGVLGHPAKLSPEAAKRLSDDWHKLHGPGRRRRVAVLEEGMTWQQTGLPPEDCQFLDSRRFSVTEIARWFCVPPHKIADLTRSTYSNIEQEEIAAVIDCLMLWARRFESEADIKLFGRNQRGAMFVKFNFNARLRGDTIARSQFYREMFDRGVFDVDDIREKEDMNPIGRAKGGAKRFVMANMQLLEKAGDVPPLGARPAPAPPAEKPAPQPDPAAAMAPVFDDAIRRCLRREAKLVARPPQAASPEGTAGWLQSLVAGQREYVKEALRAPLEALAAALGCSQVQREDAAVAVELYCRNHAAEFMAAAGEAISAGRLAEAAALWENDRAPACAARALSRLRLALLVARGES